VQYMRDLAALAWSGLRRAKYLLDGEGRDGEEGISWRL